MDPRHAVWNANAPTGGDLADGLWLMRQGIKLHWSVIPASANPGESGTVSWLAATAQGRRGVPTNNGSSGSIKYRHEYNQVRPHEALGDADSGQPVAAE